MESKTVKRIVLDGGKGFDGTFSAFKDVFFEATCVEHVELWAAQTGRQLEIEFYSPEITVSGSLLNEVSHI